MCAVIKGTMARGALAGGVGGGEGAKYDARLSGLRDGRHEYHRHSTLRSEYLPSVLPLFKLCLRPCQRSRHLMRRSPIQDRWRRTISLLIAIKST